MINQQYATGNGCQVGMRPGLCLVMTEEFGIGYFSHRKWR